MDHIDEVKETLGEDNYDLLVEAIEYGHITETKLQTIGMKLNKATNSVWKARRIHENLLETMKMMLDVWWQKELQKNEVNGLEKLVDILNHKDVELYSLAQKMKPDQKLLFNDLPTSHPPIPEWFQDEKRTGSKPTVTKQMGQTCASHSIGKAVLKILDDLQYDADEEKIIKSLIEKVQPDEKPRNPDEFTNKDINVEIWKKTAAHKKGKVQLQLRVLTQMGEVDTSGDLKTVPIDDIDKQMKMVLRWLTPYGPHAVYAKDYDKDTELYSCLNSWGEVQPKEPKLHNSMIYAVDYISIKKM